MSYGIRIYGASGELQFSSTSDSTRHFLGTYSTGTADGSVTIPGASNLVIFSHMLKKWDIQISGNKLSWKWTSQEARTSVDIEVFGSIAPTYVSHGLNIIGADGNLSIGTTLPGYYYVRKGAGVAKPLPKGTPGSPAEMTQASFFRRYLRIRPEATSDYIISSSNPDEFIALSSPSGNILTGIAVNASGNPVFTVASAEAVNLPYDYYIFSRNPPQTTPTTYGVSLNNPQGGVVFSSVHPPMRVAGSHVEPPGKSDTNFFKNATIAAPSGKYAVAVFDAGPMYEGVGQHPYGLNTCVRAVFKTSTTGATFSNKQVSYRIPYTGDIYVEPSLTSSALLLDVSGY